MGLAHCQATPTRSEKAREQMGCIMSIIMRIISSSLPTHRCIYAPKIIINDQGVVWGELRQLNGSAMDTICTQVSFKSHQGLVQIARAGEISARISKARGKFKINCGRDQNFPNRCPNWKEHPHSTMMCHLLQILTFINDGNVLFCIAARVLGHHKD
eukprot:SAG11_NODE_1027_length_6131_cov_22.835710_2_plen_157_part_00